MSVTSMTGFGNAEANTGDVSIDIEVKSVNNRFLDTVWRIPSGYSRFESELGRVVREYVKRGRVEISISRKDARTGEAQIEFQTSKRFRIRRSFVSRVQALTSRRRCHLWSSVCDAR